MKDTVKRLLRRREALALQRRLDQIEMPPALRPVAAALASTLDLSSSRAPDWVAPLEAIRERYRGSAEVLDIVDFGAGPPEADRSWDEMAAGTPSTISLDQACRASKPYFWSLFLHALARQTEARTVVELGTCLGLSAAYVATAEASRVVTLEGAAPLAALARGHFEELGLVNVEVVEGPFQSTYAGVLERCAPIDLLFVDGHHDEEATIRYFEQAKGALASGALVVFDDIDWSDGMRRAWREISAGPGSAVSLGDLGVVAPGGPEQVSLRLEVPVRLVRYSQPS